jgi:hypothetical protein
MSHYYTIIFVNMSALNNESDDSNNTIITKWSTLIWLDIMNKQETDNLEVTTVALTDIYSPFPRGYYVEPPP